MITINFFQHCPECSYFTAIKNNLRLHMYRGSHQGKSSKGRKRKENKDSVAKSEVVKKDEPNEQLTVDKNNDDNWDCPTTTCNFTTSTKELLTFHIETHNQEENKPVKREKFECKYCHKIFATKVARYSHVRTDCKSSPKAIASPKVSAKSVESKMETAEQEESLIEEREPKLASKMTEVSESSKIEFIPRSRQVSHSSSIVQSEASTVRIKSETSFVHEILEVDPPNAEANDNEFTQTSTRQFYICPICLPANTIKVDTEKEVKDHLDGVHLFSYEMQKQWNLNIQLYPLRKVCENCDDQNDEYNLSVSFCNDCKFNLCDVCTKAHWRMKVMRNHTIRTL